MRRLIQPPIVFALAVLIVLALDRAAPGPRIIAPGLAAGLALALAAAAIGLAASAVHAFRRARTSPLPWAAPAALVTSGPYRFTRNPMYLALVLLLAGLAAGLGKVTPFLVLPPFVLALDRLFIRREERRLAAHFGDAFDAWRRQVRRWL